MKKDQAICDMPKSSYTSTYDISLILSIVPSMLLSRIIPVQSNPAKTHLGAYNMPTTAITNPTPTHHTFSSLFAGAPPVNCAGFDPPLPFDPLLTAAPATGLIFPSPPLNTHSPAARFKHSIHHALPHHRRITNHRLCEKHATIRRFVHELQRSLSSIVLS
jgi:hypothetical protein